MKLKISILASSIALLIGASSCSDWLDVRPEGEILLPEFWQTEQDVQSVLAACYRGMIKDDYITRAFAYGEMRSDNVSEGNSAGEDVTDVLLQEIEPTHAYTKWTSFYDVINMCNTLLNYAPSAQAKDENFAVSTLHSIEAEAKAIRALSYFYLVRAFDKVPFITAPSIDDTQDYFIPQLDQEAILDSLIIDLNDALRYAPRIFHNNQHTKGRFTKNGIRALLADIYLWKGDYDECIVQCENIIADNSLSLIEAKDFFTSVFYTGNSSETILELQFDDKVQKNNTVTSFFGARDNSGSLQFPVELYNTSNSPFNYPKGSMIESTDDYRMYDFIQYDGTALTAKIFKYIGVSRKDNPVTDEYNFRTNTSNWILYRLADIYLMKAEAIIQRDKTFPDRKAASISEALEMVNTTYLRSNPLDDSLTYSNYSNYMDAEELILRERQRELMFEGKRYFDLVRVSRRDSSTSRIVGYVSKTSKSEKLSTNMSKIDALYWPINEEELKVNKLLNQNPFYKTSKSSL
jgi:hypothetical protein